MATSTSVMFPDPVTYTYVQYTVTTITASPIPTAAATMTVNISGNKTTTSEVLACTPLCVLQDSDGKCQSTRGCTWSDFKPTGFSKLGENTATKTSGALNLWRDPGARMAAAVLGVSWVLGMAMLKAF